MINVSPESSSKIIVHPDEVSHVTTELIRLYRDHQFVKLPKLKYILGYLLVDVSKAPSRISRKEFTEKTKWKFADAGIKKHYSSTTLGLLREPLYILYYYTSLQKAMSRKVLMFNHDYILLYIFHFIFSMFTDINVIFLFYKHMFVYGIRGVCI